MKGKSQFLYDARVAGGLSAALFRERHPIAHRPQWPSRFEMASGRLVVLSDMHRGTRGRIDDFLRCESAYLRALDYYHREGFTLAVLGDAEELWKHKPRAVLESYGETYRREAAFLREGRYLRFWGNHDGEWASPPTVRHELGEVFGGASPVVRESLLLDVVTDEGSVGRIFLVHGHQGTGLNDTVSFLARFTVRFVWKPIQHLTRMSRNTPSTNRAMREKHNRAMHRWAERHEKLLLISGHTHRPVFASISVVEELERRLGTKIEDLEGRADDEAFWDRIEADCIERGWMGDASPCAPVRDGEDGVAEPCLFNSGCCCLSDGRITGIELSDGRIRLVVWGGGRPELRRELASAALTAVFGRIS
jgi:UDP-2,3-diacylglucosamine pyrophosphatase LpxH